MCRDTQVVSETFVEAGVVLIKQGRLLRNAIIVLPFLVCADNVRPN